MKYFALLLPNSETNEPLPIKPPGIIRLRISEASSILEAVCLIRELFYVTKLGGVTSYLALVKYTFSMD